MKTACGSLAYSAPEMLLQEPYDGPSVDIWSLGAMPTRSNVLTDSLFAAGVILFMMVAGRLPFQDPNESMTVIKILDVKYTIPDHVSDDCRGLISSILVRCVCGGNDVPPPDSSIATSRPALLASRSPGTGGLLGRSLQAAPV